MDLNEILVFTRVVQAGSFTGASRELGMPKSTVSRKVSELEARLGAQLLHRTTRKLRLTDVGQAFYAHASRVVAEAEEAEHVVGRMHDTPRGLVRVTTPLNFGHIGPLVASFLTRYPDVQLDMVCTDRVVDLIEDGFDVAVRTGQLRDSTHIARSLGVMRSYLVASPAFVRKHGTPKHPRDLEQFDCILFGAGIARPTWTLQREGETLTIAVRGRFAVNDFDLLEAVARSGHGVAMLPAFRCTAQVRERHLKLLLRQWCSPDIPLHAVYPSTRHVSPKVRAFVEHLRDGLMVPS